MKKVDPSFTAIMFAFVLFSSCSSPEDKALEAVGVKLTAWFSDTILFYDKVKFNYVEDSIINSVKEKSGLDKGFDLKAYYNASSIKKSIHEEHRQKMTKNIHSILKNRKTWVAITNMNNRYWERVILTFDESFVNSNVQRIYNLFSGAWSSVENDNLPYEVVDIDGNDFYYVNIKGQQGKFLIFKKRSDAYCLIGNSAEYCSADKKVEGVTKKVDADMEINHIGKGKDNVYEEGEVDEYEEEEENDDFQDLVERQRSKLILKINGSKTP